jgi:hypothetical protein
MRLWPWQEHLLRLVDVGEVSFSYPRGGQEIKMMQYAATAALKKAAETGEKQRVAVVSLKDNDRAVRRFRSQLEFMAAALELDPGTVEVVFYNPDAKLAGRPASRIEIR